VVGLGQFGFFNFGSIRFGFRSQVPVLGFGFFRFGIRIPPQCKSIVVRENTKMESMYFDGKFSLVAFSALTLLAGRQEGHLACKKMGGWWRWALVSWMEWH